MTQPSERTHLSAADLERHRRLTVRTTGIRTVPQFYTREEIEEHYLAIIEFDQHILDDYGFNRWATSIPIDPVTGAIDRGVPEPEHPLVSLMRGSPHPQPGRGL